MIALLLLLFVFQENVRELVEKLGSDSLELREDAVEKLKKIGKPALPELEKAAKSGDAETVERAKYLLRLIPIQDRVPARLLRLMPDLPDTFVPDDPHAWTALLVEAMNRHIAYRSEHGEPLFKPGDLDGIVPLAFRGIRDKQDKDWLCSAVFHLGLKSAAPEVAKLLDDPLPAVRECALETLLMIESRLAIPGCRARLAHPDPYVKVRACDTLVEMDDRESIPAIAALLKSDAGLIRGTGALALARLGAVERAREIGDLLEDPDVNVRFYALKAAAELGLRKEAGRIRPLLKSPDVAVRVEAIRALEVVEGRDALPALRELKEDRTPLVQSGLSVAFCNLGARDGVAAILNDGEGYFLLNGVRRPERWSRLGSLTIQGTLSGTPAELRAELEKRSGMKIEWPAIPPGQEKEELRLGRGRDPLYWVDAVNRIVPGECLIVENDRIRFIPLADAKKFWEDWWEKEKK